MKQNREQIYSGLHKYSSPPPPVCLSCNIYQFCFTLFFYSLRYQRQARRPTLCPQMDLTTGCKGDPCSAQRLEIRLHGLRSFLFHPQNHTYLQTTLMMTIPLDLTFIVPRVAFLKFLVCTKPRFLMARCLLVMLLWAKHAKLLKQPLDM